MSLVALWLMHIKVEKKINVVENHAKLRYNEPEVKMKINYILSDTTKGATSEALKTVAAKAEANLFEPFLVIVPETKSIIIEKELLSCSRAGGYANVQVYSFVRLLSRLGEVNPETILSKQTCILLIRKIISDNSERLLCYRRAKKTVGFAEKIYDTIAQFKSSNISPDDLRPMLESCDATLKSKLADILLLYEEYEAALADKFFDDCGRLNLLKDFATKSDVLKSAEVFVVGFDNITYEMQSVLKAISAKAKEITFSCVFFGKSRADSRIQNNELFKKFTHIADELHYPYVPRFVKTNKLGDFRVLQHYLFACQNADEKTDEKSSKNNEKITENSIEGLALNEGSELNVGSEQTAESEARKFHSHGQVVVFESSSKKREIDFVANTILNCVAEGARFKDFGVMLANFKEEKELIKEAFEAYNIPYFVNESHEVSGHFFVEFIKLAFKICRLNLQPEEVLCFVSNAIFNARDVGEFVCYVKETGCSYSEFLEGVDENYLCDEDKKQSLAEDLNRLREFYLAFRAGLQECARVSDYIDVLKQLFSYFDAENRLLVIAEAQREQGRVIEAEICATIFQKLQAFLVQMQFFFGEAEVEAEEFLQIFLSGVSSLHVNLSPVSIDCVVVQENTDGFFGIKQMFIVGAEEGKFPAKIQDAGIILDSEIASVNEGINKIIEPMVSDINRRENYRIYEALLEPTDKLFISYSLKSFGGGSLTAARVVKKIQSLFAENITQKRYDFAKNSPQNARERIFASHVNMYLKGEYLISDLCEEYSILLPKLNEYFLRAIDARNLKPNFFVDSAGMLSLQQGKVSVSKLETYFACPYKYFARYGLGLKQAKSAKLTSLDIGNILHKVAEIFAGKMELARRLLEEKLDSLILEIARQAMKEFHIRVEKNIALASLIEEESKRLCRFLIFEQENSSFKLVDTEYSFGEENGTEIYSKNDKNIYLVGKIDRIDEFFDYIRIIDYKTGNVSSDLKSIYFGRKIQLPAYLLAVQSRRKNKVAGLFYLPIHSNFSEDETDAESQYKMRGFILHDVDVVHHMDNSLSASHKISNLVPIQIKTNSSAENSFEFGGRIPETMLSSEEFREVEDYIKKLSGQAIEEILSGNIEPAPAKDNENGRGSICSYCEFYGSCGLEKSRFSLGRTLSGKVNVNSFKEAENGGD